MLVPPVLADTTPPVKGTLCFVAPRQAPKCNGVEGETIAIPAADVERPVVWSSADGKSAVLELAPAKSEKIDLTDKSLRSVTLSVRGDRPHGWPEDLRINVSDAKKHQWTWIVPAKAVEALSQIRVPDGNYTIALGADHHVSTFRRIAVKGDASLREIVLRPMPVVSGRVLSTKDEPIANAQIVRPDGKSIAGTDEQGNFRGEAGEPLPDSALVEKSGFGSLILPLQLVTGDADLGVLRLGAGVKLTLHIVRPEDNHDALHVSLKREVEKKYEYTPIAAKDLAAGDDTLVFADLTKGKYFVITEGKGALEKFATDIEVGKSDLQKEIRIEPYRLDGTARIGDDPMTGELGVGMGRIRMEITLPIQDGRFSATLWQHGKLMGWVRAKDLGTPEVMTSPELGADPSTWDIQLPKRFISGRIYDAETRQSISGAKMDLLRTSHSPSPSGTLSESRMYSSVRLHDDGTYSIMSTQVGTYELKVSAPEHVDMKQTVDMHEDDPSVQRDFAMSRGIPATLEVSWPSGVPVTNAAVMEGVASDGHNPERVYVLDATGHLALRLQQGESRTLDIIPAEGSFAVVHVNASEQSDSNTIRVTVPNPAGSLKIHIATKDGKNVLASVAMRFNGEIVPVPVLIQIGFRASSAVNDRLLLQMPAGAYELWPVSLMSHTPIGAVKSVSVSAGETDVDLVANP